ncbi:MAG: hypothetical protein L3K15_02210 [Thermoplasmata archaeon]|nr:hypothetical protein [Thermoplasmata archaeon]
MRKELAELVDLENVCCSHLSWTVTSGETGLLLTVSGPDSELEKIGAFLDS